MSLRMDNWTSVDYQEDDGSYGQLFQTAIGENLCTIIVDYESPIQATLKCNVIIENEGKKSVRYFWKRRFVGLVNLDFEREMGERIIYKQAELELIAMDKDLS